MGILDVPASAAVRKALVHPRKAANLTRGLYARTTPTPDSGQSIYVLCKDPNQNGANGTGRLWAYGNSSTKIGYTDDDGATFTPVQSLPAAASGLTVCQIEITSGVAGGDFMFIVLNSSAANQGQIWRAPAPGATPASLTFTQILGFDATTNIQFGPAGTAGHTADGSNLRNQSFAIQPDGSYAYCLNYAAGVPSVAFPTRTGMMAAGGDILYLPAGGFNAAQHGLTVSVPGAGAAGATLTTTLARIFSSTKAQVTDAAQTAVTGATITFSGSLSQGDLYGGPTMRVCANPCAASPSSVLWTSPKTWSFAKHGHAVKVINGIPWANLGDFPYPSDAYGLPPTTHVGMWAAADATGATWTQKMSPNAYSPLDGINFFPVTIDGQTLIVMESDSKSAVGPVFLPTVSNAAGVVPQFESTKVQLPVVATMRSLAITADGNLMWYGTGEGGGVGPVDGIFVAAPPFDTPILLEQLTAGTAGNLYNATVSNGYVWIGKLRIRCEKFADQ